MKLAWLTDIHLDLVDGLRQAELCSALSEARVDAVLVSGDIGQAETFADHLSRLASHVDRPIYFVLGNHDYYGASISETRRVAKKLNRFHPQLHWLPDAGVIELGAETALVGHGCFGDGRFGAGLESSLELADHTLTDDFRELNRSELFSKLNRLGDEAAATLRELVISALARSWRVFVLTHVPPFAEVSHHRGRENDQEALPFYTCAAVGAMLLEVMRVHPEHKMTVLCGHTHSSAEFHPLPNVEVFAGESTYGQPRIQRIFTVSGASRR